MIKKSNKRITVTVSGQMYKDIEKVAAELGLSSSAVANMLMEKSTSFLRDIHNTFINSLDESLR